MSSAKKVVDKVPADDFARLVELEKRLARLSVEMKRIADKSGLSRREIAHRMGKSSPSNLQRLLGGAAYNASLETLAHLAWACGYELTVSLSPPAGMHFLKYPPSTASEPTNVIDMESYIKRYEPRQPEWPNKASHG